MIRSVTESDMPYKFSNSTKTRYRPEESRVIDSYYSQLCHNPWVITGYGLSQVWVMTESTVIPNLSRRQQPKLLIEICFMSSNGIKDID